MEIVRPWPESSPEGVLVRAFRAFVARDGRALAALASQESLAAYRAQVHQETTPRWHVWTAEALQRAQPDMPLEAAEYQVAAMARGREGHEASLLRQFAGVTSLEELRALDVPSLLDRALSVAPRGMTDVPKLQVLGHVREGDATAHVLYRTGWRGPDGELAPLVGTPQLATLRKEGEDWRLDLDAGNHVGMPGYGAVIYIGDDSLPPERDDDGSGPGAPAA